MELDSKGEVWLTLTYIERSWNATNKQVVSTWKNLLDNKIDYASTIMGFKEVTNAPDNAPNEWFQMGGYSTNGVEYYVVLGNVKRETIVVMGKNVHLILLNGATLTLTGGLILEDDHKLYIHSQSYGSNMGRLMVTNKYEKAAGIGSAQHEGKNMKAGALVIHGGHIEANGGENAAGIGSCARSDDDGGDLCNSVTIFGGYVKATGGDNGAGIGGGDAYHNVGVSGGVFVLYDGTVIAQGGEKAAGVGGGEDGSGYKVIINGGTVYAFGNGDGAGIGGGENGGSGILDLRWGKVIAKAGNQGGTENRAIGPGKGNSNFLNLTIGEGLMVGTGNNGSVERIVFKDERVQACWYRSYAEISPCTHPH
ncbi:MAG: hypothetical protein IKI26_06480, partial [Prevotella sp.]|nr:hypothetical protein [Prevotella sp.]